MSRSAERLAAAGIALTAAVTVSWCASSGRAAATGGVIVVPVHAGPVATAPVVDLAPPVVDVVTATADLDGGVTDETGDGHRSLILAGDVFFAFDKATLTASAQHRLTEVVAAVRAAGATSMQVDGYTDSRGTPSHNQVLSLQRAQAVAQRLKALLPGVRIAVAGHGAADPVAPNTVQGRDNPAGRAQNRRVVVTLRG